MLTGALLWLLPKVQIVEGGGGQDLGWRVLALVQASDDGGLDPMEAEAGLLVFLLTPSPFLCYFN